MVSQHLDSLPARPLLSLRLYFCSSLLSLLQSSSPVFFQFLEFTRPFLIFENDLPSPCLSQRFFALSMFSIIFLLPFLMLCKDRESETLCVLHNFIAPATSALFLAHNFLNNTCPTKKLLNQCDTKHN